MPNVTCGKRRGCCLWPRDLFLEQVLARQKGEIVGGCAEKSWDEVRRADMQELKSAA